MHTSTQSIWRHVLAVAVTALIVFGISGTTSADLPKTSADAPNGTFDPTFGNYLPGRSLVQLASENSFVPIPYDIAVLTDQRLVIAGAWAGPGTASFVNMIAARLNADGAVDFTFGDDGIAYFTPPGAAFGSIAKQVLPLADGKLLLVGYACYADGNESNCDVVACRLDAGGTLDPGYAGNGCARVGFDLFPDADDLGTAAALDASGRAVIAVTIATDPNDIFASKAAVVRLTADGALDTTFGANGRSIVLRYEAIAGEPTYEYANALVIDPAGRILVAGSSYVVANTSGSRDFAVARLNANGQLDPGFGDGGVVTQDFYGYADAATGIGVQRNGRVILGGNSSGQQSRQNFAVLGLTNAGALDPTFGYMGRLSMAFLADGNSPCLDMLIQPDDRIVLVGRTSYMLAVERLTAYGGEDTQFGDLTQPPIGLFAHSFFPANPAPDASLRAVALQGHRIVASGYAQRVDDNGLVRGMVVIRLTQDTLFADDFEPPLLPD